MKLLSAVLFATMLLQSGGGSTDLDARVQALATAFPGEMGVFARNLNTGQTIAINADTRFPTASVIKLAVLVEAFHQIAEGKISPDTKITLRASDKVGIGDSGTINELHDGTELTVSDLLNLMIVVSDNTATNLIVARLGTVAVNARMESYGLRQTKIFRPTFRDGRPDCCPELEREFGLGMSTPRETATLMELIATERSVSPAASQQMFDILRRQQNLLMIPRRLPGDTGIITANKTGTDAEKMPGADGSRGHIHNDVAIVKTPRATYVLAIYSRKGKSRTWGADNDALVAGAEISRTIYEAWGR